MIKVKDTQNIPKISTDSVYNHIKNKTATIIDIRPTESYNGWKMHQEMRGGHIKGAKSLPIKWLHYIDWIEIVQSKNITPDQTLIIYGYDTNNIHQVATQFKSLEYQQVFIYTQFLNEWTTNEKLPMEQLPRYRNLVSPEWLHQLIATGTAPEYDNRRYVLCHAHYQNRSAYEKGHIPNAIDLDTNLLESSETWNRRKPDELHSVFEELGIDCDTTVILYGRFSYPKNTDPFPGSSAGHLGAFRCALILLYAGVKDVRILDGGLQAWIDAGFETTTEEYKNHPIKDFGCHIPAHPEYIVDLKEAEQILTSNDKNLVSVRSWREFIGDVSGYHYIEKKGRIPGAVFGNCGSDAYHMENYRNLDHTIREFHEIQDLWKKAGITREKYNAFYCGTGWRGSEAFFSAWLMDWPHISVFDGGWFEWSKNNKAYETGKPMKEEHLTIN